MTEVWHKDNFGDTINKLNFGWIKSCSTEVWQGVNCIRWETSMRYTQSEGIQLFLQVVCVINSSITPLYIYIYIFIYLFLFLICFCTKRLVILSSSGTVHYFAHPHDGNSAILRALLV